MFSIILSCDTEVPVRHGRGGGGFGNCGVFFAHNYVSEHFGNYVKYGKSLMIRRTKSQKSKSIT